MTLTHLGTGSRGNATLLETEHSKVIIDQGFSGAQFEKRLRRMNLDPGDIHSIFITHHHGDHGGGAALAQKRWNIPVWANKRTAEALGLEDGLTHHFEALDMIEAGPDLTLLPVPVPHSDAENVAFVASHNGHRAAVITDLGSWTDELVTHVRGCEHISVEANYDENRLMNGPYPYSLKERISGRGGHLSNDQTGEFLSLVCTPETKSITLTHLSGKNNLPHLAESTVLYYIEEVFDGDIWICGQEGPEQSHFIGKENVPVDAKT